jgi:hypothetical protein
MPPFGIVPVQVLSNAGACSAHTVIGHQIHPLALHATPKPFHKYIVPPCTLAINGELATLVENGYGEFLHHELATLIRVDDSGLANLVNASSVISLAWQASSVIATLWVSTRRLATSTTALRYTKPLAMGM